jgi:hypothetical protein
MFQPSVLFPSIYTSIDHFNHTRGAGLKEFHGGRDSVLGEFGLQAVVGRVLEITTESHHLFIAFNEIWNALSYGGRVISFGRFIFTFIHWLCLAKYVKQD